MKDLTLVREETEMNLKQIAGGRSVCIDVTGVDSNGKYYDLEIQRADKGAGAHRVRYHSSMMDRYKGSGTRRFTTFQLHNYSCKKINYCIMIASDCAL